MWILNKLQYISHCILNSKYKILIHIALYILVSTLIANSISTTECMNQNSSEENISQITPRSINSIEHIRNLEQEISRLNDRINLLEQGLRHNLEQRLIEREHYESLLQVATADIQELHNDLHESYQIITDTNRLVNSLLRENANLRVDIEQAHSSIATDLESESENI